MIFKMEHMFTVCIMNWTFQPWVWCYWNIPGELTVSLTLTATNGSNGSDVVTASPLSTWSSLTRMNPTPGIVLLEYSQDFDYSLSTYKTQKKINYSLLITHKQEIIDS